METKLNRLNRQSSRLENRPFTPEVDLLEGIIDEIGVPPGSKKEIVFLETSYALRVRIIDVYDRKKEWFVSISVAAQEYRDRLKYEFELLLRAPWK